MTLLKQAILLLCISGIMSTAYAQQANKGAPTLVKVEAIFDGKTGQHLFKTDTKEIPSGWTTFRFTNASFATHFLIVEHFPPGRSVADMEEAGPIFQEAMNLINAGKREEGLAKLGDLPEWFKNFTMMGGPGLTNPGHTTETTVKLVPGNYSIECYIKNEEGKFHSAMGMVRELIVTDEQHMATPPVPSIEMSLTNAGFGVKGKLTPGKHIVAVHFNEENPPPYGNDVHLAKLDKNTDITTVTRWMDWTQPDGFISTHEQPAPATFLGGTHEMPMGNTAYFKIDLQPGRYAWISERSADNPLYEEFTVPSIVSTEKASQ